MTNIIQLLPILLVMVFGTTALAEDQFAATMNSLLNGKNIFPEYHADARNFLSITTGEELLSNFRSSLENPNVLENVYENYKQLYRKKYAVEPRKAQTSARITHFKDQLIEIAKHNIEARAGKVTYEKGVNLFTDMTNDELQQYTGLKRTDETNLKSVSIDNLPRLSQPCASPNDNFCDWRNFNAVSSIKDQGQCGSCAFFAATAALESALFLNRRSGLLDLSEEELLDCGVGMKGYWGCKGNYLTMPLTYIETHGLSLEKDYPYTQISNECKSEGYSHSPKTVRWSYVLPQGNEKALQEAVRVHGPVMVGIYASPDFVSYRTGVFSGDNCKADINHAVLVVGYGTDEKGIDYWIVKNSWSSYWGNEGYVLMRRNYNNMCHIASSAFAISA